MRRVATKHTLVHFTTTYRKFPGDVRGLDWSAVYDQELRFRVLLEELRERDPNDEVLDIGCGYGDLSREISWTPHYLGVDVNPLMVRTADRRHPLHRFRCADLFDLNESCDWALASGAFNLETGRNDKLIKAAIEKMWSLSRKGVIFNVHVRSQGAGRRAEMHEYAAGEILELRRTLAPKVNCRTDYLPDDATFSLRR